MGENICTAHLRRKIRIKDFAHISLCHVRYRESKQITTVASCLDALKPLGLIDEMKDPSNPDNDINNKTMELTLTNVH